MFFGTHLHAGQPGGPNFFEDHCLDTPRLRMKFQINLDILSVSKMMIKISVGYEPKEPLLRGAPDLLLML